MEKKLTKKKPRVSKNPLDLSWFQDWMLHLVTPPLAPNGKKISIGKFNRLKDEYLAEKQRQLNLRARAAGIR